MREQILEIIASETGETVTEDTPLSELGLESLEFLDLILTIQEATGIVIPDAEVSKLETVGDLLEAFERHTISA